LELKISITSPEQHCSSGAGDSSGLCRDTRSTTIGTTQSDLCSTRSSYPCPSVCSETRLSEFLLRQPVVTLCLRGKKIPKNQESLPLDHNPTTATATVEFNDPREQAERIFKFCRQPVQPSRVQSFIDISINRIYQVWKVFGFASESPYNLDRAKRLVRNVYNTFRSTSPMGVVKTLKFLILSFVRFWKGDSYEHDLNFSQPLAHPGSLFPGRGERFITRLKRCDRVKFDILINTMLISCKGCLPRPDKDCQDDAIVDWIKEIFLVKRVPRNEDLATRIRQYVHELIGFKRCSLKDIFLVPKCPSTSANYVNGRGDGGAVLSVCDMMKEKGHPSLTFDDVILDKTFVWSDSKDEERCLIPEWIEDEPLWELMVDKGLIQSNYEKFLRVAIDAAVVEEPLVKPVALSEALKVRMITKCPPFLMFVMNAFIDPLRKFLRSLDTFELTGTPQEETIMDRMFRDPTRMFLSGDYKASTDRLHSWVSECIVDELCETFYADVVKEDPRWIHLFRRSLTGFRYAGKDGKTYDQQNGQLMGSVSSFPVLCLANYALCRMAMELNPWDWTGLLINGDDCVFEASDDCRHEWARLGKLFGLEPSAGKVDYKSGYIQMNSRSFIPLRDPELANRLLNQAQFGYNDVDDNVNCCYYRFPEVEDYVKSPHRLWWKIPLVLAGVAQGLTRSSTESLESVDLQKIDYQGSRKSFLFELKNAPRDLLKNADSYFQKTYKSHVFKELDYVKAHQPRIWSKIRHVPYNLPRRFGGLGFDGEPSSRDLDVARFLFKNGQELASDSKTWKFHSFVNTHLSKHCPAGPTLEESDYGPLYWVALTQYREKVFRRDDDYDPCPVARRMFSYEKGMCKRQIEFERLRRKVPRTPIEDPISVDLLRDFSRKRSFNILYLGERSVVEV
jgi:hypothetical protein